jgi:hypothetical protein
MAEICAGKSTVLCVPRSANGSPLASIMTATLLHYAMSLDSFDEDGIFVELEIISRSQLFLHFHA